ncbi:hypothetical protein CTU88_44050 [Streptomyces sp. JV178]|uniref:hypothetical protein n=1 Tax=Streptomyces sp. JV178 TaxID=858632 RepID=UPI000C1B3AD5|nr:hypothetical protein [Streptomyces sp. JV178]PIM66235.1 hypothetical protein CTU88_44050 [Streptomyces sp. JV178]
MVDIAWWELRYALPAPVLTAAIGAVAGLATLVLSAAGRAVRFLEDYYLCRDSGLFHDSCAGRWLRGFGFLSNFIVELLPVLLPLRDASYDWPPEDWWWLLFEWPTGAVSASIYIALGFVVGSVARLRSGFLPTRRLRRSFNSRKLALSLLCSLTTGVLAALGYGSVAGLFWGTIALSVCAIVTGLTALPADARTAASPITLLREDQRSLVQFLVVPVLAGSLLIGPVIALGFTAADEDVRMSDYAVVATSGAGFSVGCILGVALALNPARGFRRKGTCARLSTISKAGRGGCRVRSRRGRGVRRGPGRARCSGPAWTR